MDRKTYTEEFKSLLTVTFDLGQLFLLCDFTIYELFIQNRFAMCI